MEIDKDEREVLGTLPTEARRPETSELDALTGLEMVWAMHRADREALLAVERALPQVAVVVEAAAERLAASGACDWGEMDADGLKGRGQSDREPGWAAGRLVYAGAGTSGRLGVLDAAECPPTFATPPGMVVGLLAGGERALRKAVEGAEDDRAAGAAAVRAIGVGERDVVVGIAASGRTPWVLGVMEAARQAGALTVGLSCVPGSAVEGAGSRAASETWSGASSGIGVQSESETGSQTMEATGAAQPDDGEAGDRPLAITVDTGAEVVTGSTRLKAGTATKLVLNMISTGVMVRLGYVYGNLMVNVQPTNAKLRDRAVRIVGEICGLGAEEAARALELAGDVKTAVVMVRLGLERGAAEIRLAKAGGVLRRALEE